MRPYSGSSIAADFVGGAHPGDARGEIPPDHVRGEIAVGGLGGGLGGAGGSVLWQAQHLQGAGAVVAAADEAPLLQRRNQPVDAGLGPELQGFLHLLEAGGEAGLFQVAIDIDQQLVLFPSEHGAGFSLN